MFAYLPSLAIVILLSLPITGAFSLVSRIPPSSREPIIGNLRAETQLHLRSLDDDGELTSRPKISRRDLLLASAGIFLGIPTASPIIQPANAEEERTIWLTGKAPKVPGQKPKDKGDYSGTKKDPSFLRSLSDCKSQCENTPGPDGLARSKEDCLSDCQDICCTTYEQCTFAIVPRI